MAIGAIFAIAQHTQKPLLRQAHLLSRDRRSALVQEQGHEQMKNK